MALVGCLAPYTFGAPVIGEIQMDGDTFFDSSEDVVDGDAFFDPEGDFEVGDQVPQTDVSVLESIDKEFEDVSHVGQSSDKITQSSKSRAVINHEGDAQNELPFEQEDGSGVPFARSEPSETIQELPQSKYERMDYSQLSSAAEKNCDIKELPYNSRTSLYAASHYRTEWLDFTDSDKIFDPDCYEALKYYTRMSAKFSGFQPVSVRIYVEDGARFQKIASIPFGKEFEVILSFGSSFNPADITKMNEQFTAALGVSFQNQEQDLTFSRFLQSIHGDMSRLTSLRFLDHQVSVETAQIVIDNLSKMTKLNMLSIGIPEGMDVQFLSALKAVPLNELAMLDLTQSSMSHEGVKLVAEYVESAPKTLTQLGLASSGLTDTHLDVLLPAFKASHLRKININRIRFTSRGAQLVAQFLMDPKNIMMFVFNGKVFKRNGPYHRDVVDDYQLSPVFRLGQGFDRDTDSLFHHMTRQPDSKRNLWITANAW